MRGHGQHEQVQDADVAVQIERALHLRQIVGAHERLLVDEQHRDRRHAGEVDAAERRRPSASAARHSDRDDVHRARDRQRRRRRRTAPESTAGRARDRSRDPDRHRARRSRRPRCRSPAASSHGSQPAAAADGQPAADRRHRHRQAEKQLRPGREALGQRVPEHDARAPPATARSRADSAATAAKTKTADATTTNSDRFARAHRAARQLAVRGARVERVEPRVDEPVESHRRAARRHHRDENPADRRSTVTIGSRCRAAPAARRPAQTAARTPSG